MKGHLQIGRKETLRVHVQGSHGRRVEHVLVKLFGRGAGISRTLHGTTESHGTVTFHNVRVTRAGTVVIKAVKSGWQIVKVRIIVH